MGPHDPLLLDLIKALLTFAGGILVAMIANASSRKTAKVVEKTAQVEALLKPLVSANTAWEALAKPMVDRIDKLEKHVETVEAEGKERETQFLRAITLLVTWGTWIDAGAAPPPPQIPAWLREQMVQVIQDAQEFNK